MAVLDSEFDYTVGVQQDQRKTEAENNLKTSASFYHENKVRQLENLREKNSSEIVSALSHIKKEQIRFKQQ